MKRKLLFLLVLLLTVGMGNLAWADDIATQEEFWRFNRLENYGEGQFDADAQTLVIKTAEELAKFASEVIDYDGYAGWTITLDNDIDLSAKYWRPIGSNNAFKGYFNGNGHTITGVKINSSLISVGGKNDPATLRYNAFGLFGIVEGTVENITLANPEIHVLENGTSSSGFRVAALVGHLKAGGTICNCFVNGGSVHGKQYVGALVGQAESNGTNSALASIVGCNSSATVQGVSYVGGLVGQLTGNASLRYSLYTGNSGVTAPESAVSNGYAGLVIGDMSGSTASGESKTEKNYFTDSDLTPKNSRDRKAYTVSCISTTEAQLDFGPSLDYSLSGIAAYEHILKYGGSYLAGADDEVTFGLTINPGLTYIRSVLVNGKRADKVSPTSYAFTMGNEDAVVTASILTDNSWDQEAINTPGLTFDMNEETKTITITSAEHMGLLAYNVNEGINDYKGWTIEIGDAATASQGVLYMGGHTWVPIGTPAHPFRGTFDGKGKTISHLVIADTRWATDYTGLFGYVSEGTIKGVRLESCLIGGNNYVGGIAGALAQTASPNAKVEDCNVDVSCVITGSGEYVGGIVGYAQLSTSVEGCVNAAPVQGVARVGGIVGQIDAYATVSNNIFNGLDGDVTATSRSRCAYIIGNINSYLYNTQNNYTLTSNKINDYDTQGYSVTSGNNNITLTFTDEGEATATYTTSGIKAYADHLRFGDVYYAPKSETPIAVTLGYADSETAEFSNVTASSGTLTAVADNNENNSKHVLTLNDDNQTNCVITAIVSGGLYWTDETYRATQFTTQIDNTITIGSAAELALLAYNVNNGVNTYQGYTITLSDNISLASAVENVSPRWLPIGTNQHPFQGTFDGDGKTISDMTVNGGVINDVGLFGYIHTDGKVQNLTVSNSKVTGSDYVGIIAGRIFGVDGTITNCTVDGTNTVTGEKYVGGIVGHMLGTRTKIEGCWVKGDAITGTRDVGGIIGYCGGDGIILGCRSAATVTGTINCGGVAGESAATMRHCVYEGSSVTGQTSVAAIIGRLVYSDYGTYKWNYFTNASLRGLNDYDTYAMPVTAGTGVSTVSLYTGGVNSASYNTGITAYYKHVDGQSDNNHTAGLKIGDNIYLGYCQKTEGNGNSRIDCEAKLNVQGTPNNTILSVRANGDATVLKNDAGNNLTNDTGNGIFSIFVDGSANSIEITAIESAFDFAGNGTEEDPYLIYTIDDMNHLAQVVNHGTENYLDKYFRLENNLDYNDVTYTPIGLNAEKAFQGYFDGNKKTISNISYTSSATSGNEYLGIFGYIQYGKVSHLHLTNSSFIGARKSGVTSYVGGIAGYCHSSNANSLDESTTIYDCFVENTTLKGKFVGGIVAWVGDSEYNKAKANVEGCVSSAIVEATKCVGGVIGWMRGNSLQVKNCLYTGNSVTLTTLYTDNTGATELTGHGTAEATYYYKDGDDYVAVDAIGVRYQAYGVANYNSTGISSLDIYHTLDLTIINDRDRRGYTVTPVAQVDLGDGNKTSLTLEFTEPTFHYDLTGIQGYKVGLSYNHNNILHFYATKDQTAKFTLEPGRGSIKSVTAIALNDGNAQTVIEPTDAVYSLTLGASDYTIGANVTIEWAGTGTKDDPYIIDDIQKMNLLSERSQNSSFEGKHFRLTTDLDYTQAQQSDYSTDVWTAIGTDQNNNFIPVRGFRGTFDGNGHTISGVKVSTTNSNRHAGIFATTRLKSTVKNLTVTNSTFESTNGHAGGIVGSVVFDYDGGTEPFIQNCHVGNDVYVTSNAATGSAGGIVGNQDVGQLIGCTSAATVKQTGSNGYAGGIVGSTTYVHTTIHDNIYLGNSITATNGGVVDAINANSKKAENVYANFYTDAKLSSSIGSKAYEYSTEDVIYTANPAYTYSVDQKNANGTTASTKAGVIRYDNNLLRFGNNYYSKFQKGDANGDGSVSITDGVSIVNKIKDNPSSSFNEFAGDTNGDGSISITDAVRVVNIIKGIVK